MQSGAYRKFDTNIVPWFMMNRPHLTISHALERIEKAKNADFTGIKMTAEGEFIAISFDGVKKSYKLCFGDDDNRPNCTCLDFQVLILGSIFPHQSSFEQLLQIMQNSPGKCLALSELLLDFYNSQLNSDVNASFDLT